MMLILSLIHVNPLRPARIPTLLLLIVVTSLVIGTPPTDGNGVKTRDQEYCWQTFNASCGSDEVILMERAAYGRMRLGRCLTRDYYVGCSADVLHYTDRRCSGRRQCDFPIPDTSLHPVQPCPKDLVAYLEASYMCVKVLNSESQNCRSTSPPRLIEAPGYLASVTAPKEGGPSANACPWRIVVSPGQRVNVTLYDFNLVLPSDDRQSGTVCQVYAVINERAASTDVTVCGGDRRQRTVYLSESNSIDIQVMTISDDENNGHFLLKYEAVGCPDLEAPKGGWIKRRSDRLTISCNSSGETRHLVCSGTRWIGEVRNCSQGSTAAVAELISGENDFPFGLIIAIVIGVLLGVILGVLLLATVTCCQKRIHRNRNGRNTIFITRASRPNNIRSETDKTPGAVVRTSDYGYAHVWELQHLRGSPEYHGDVTKEPRNGKTCIPVTVEQQQQQQQQQQQHHHHDHGPGTFPGRKNKDHMYESPQFQQTDDVISGQEDGPFYHEFDIEVQDLNTFSPPSRLVHHEPDCIHMTLSDRKL